MHSIAARLPGGGNDTGDTEIGRCTAPLEGPSLVHPADVQRGRIVLRVDAHGRDAKFGSGLGNADGDLAAVGDQEFLDHVGVG